MNVLGLNFDVNTAIAYSILTIFAAYKLIRALALPGRLQEELGDLLKEVAVFFVVLSAITLLPSVVAVTPTSTAYNSTLTVGNSINTLINEAYMRIVKAQQCIANIRLSGPLGAYGSYADAKLSLYTTVYESALWWLNQLSGLQYVLAIYGPVVLAIAFAIYAAWLRPVGGALIGVILGMWIGVLLFAYYAPSGIQILQGQLASMDFHPFISIGCDDQLVKMYSVDIQAWRSLLALAVLTMSLSTLIGGTAGYLLGRH